MAKIDKELAQSPLIFPSESDLVGIQISRELTEDEEQRWTDAWTQVTG